MGEAGVRRIAVVLVLAFAASCAPTEPPTPPPPVVYAPPPPRPPPPPVDQCGAAPLQTLIGRPRTEIPVPHSGGTAVESLGVYRSAVEPAPALFVGMDYEAFTRGARFSGIGEWRGCGPAGIPFCFGDGSDGPCPCGRGAFHHGCDNSASTGGAVLDASGWTSLAFDSLTLTASGELPRAASILLQGDAESAPTSFGQGLRCVGGRTKRLFVAQAVGGIFSVPGPGQPSISARSGALGDPLFVGASRVYQAIYRDRLPDPGTCPIPPGGAWNLTSARRIAWLP